MVKMNFYESPMFWIGVVALIVVGWAVWPSGPGEWDSFAECLSESGVVMYGTDWCSHCKDQKALFGKSFDKIDFVDCDFDRDECLIAGVSGYPTWKIKGENYPGTRPLSELASLAGCELVKG